MKKRTIIAIASVAAIGGCAAVSLGGNTTSSTTIPVKDTAKTATPEKGATGNWRILGDPQPTRERFTGDYTMAFRVTNISDGPATAMFQVSIVKGDKLLGSLDCIGTGNQTPAGATTKVTCTSLEKFRPGWSAVEIEDSGW